VRNPQEYALTTSGNTAVNSTNFGSCFLHGGRAIYAQPLWVQISRSLAEHTNVDFVATNAIVLRLEPTVPAAHKSMALFWRRKRFGNPRRED